MNWQSASSETGTIATGSPSPTPGPYIGRFAPSPTGPLHFGSLIAAVASYLEARSRGGQWLLRVEDIDPPREQPGATRAILNALEAYGFEWDGGVSYQSDSRPQHDDAIAALVKGGLAYPCGCSRRQLGRVYPGTCRTGTTARDTALRVRTNDDPIRYVDRLQGTQMQRLESACGDFIVLRKDGLIAYQLAVVVDDHLQGVTEIVRGIDLIESTPRQIHLQQLLGYSTPVYAHIPVAINSRNQKLSKSYGAHEILLDRAAETLLTALQVLGQRPDDDLAAGSLADIWGWALAHWDMDRLHGKTQVPVGHIALARAGNLEQAGNCEPHKNP